MIWGGPYVRVIVATSPDRTLPGGAGDEQILHFPHSCSRSAKLDNDVLLCRSKCDFGQSCPTINRTQILANLYSRQTVEEGFGRINLDIDQRRGVSEVARYIGCVGRLLHGVQYELCR